MALYNAVKKMVNKHYQNCAEDNCNSCNMGTWYIERQQVLAKKSGGYAMKALLDRFAKKESSADCGCETKSKACTADAEAGRCKILVVCKGDRFSRAVADYAINMASRTRSELVALSLDEGGQKFNEFRAEAERNVEHFAAKANDAGIRFAHEIKRGMEEAVVNKLYQGDARFRYVVTDTAAAGNKKSVIPVYTRATLRT